MAAAEQVTLVFVTKKNGSNAEGTRAFAVDHAERILNLRRPGYILPKNSPYTFKDGVLRKKDQGSNKD